MNGRGSLSEEAQTGISARLGPPDRPSPRPRQAPRPGTSIEGPPVTLHVQPLVAQAYKDVTALAETTLVRGGERKWHHPRQNTGACAEYKRKDASEEGISPAQAMTV